MVSIVEVTATGIGREVRGIGRYDSDRTLSTPEQS